MTFFAYICKTQNTDNHEKNRPSALWTDGACRLQLPKARFLPGQDPSARSAGEGPALETLPGGEDRPGPIQLPGHRKPGNQGLQLVERGSAWGRPQRVRHRFPAADRHGILVRRGETRAGFHRRFGRSPREEPPGRRIRPGQAVSGTYFLDPEYQHLPRPALGTRHGDLRRRSVPDGSTGHGGRPRPAGTGGFPDPQGARLRQALCRPFRPGVQPPPL